MASPPEEQGYDVNRFPSAVRDDCCCPICLGVLKDPVMCHNEHYFCRLCISRHLQNSLSCPKCIQHLTLSTLRPAPRLMTNFLSELLIKCDYAERGCRENVSLENLAAHALVCEFVPVECENEGCRVVVSRRDLAQHERDTCQFRRVSCHNCRYLKQGFEKMVEKLDRVEENVQALQERIQYANIHQATLSETIRVIKTNEEEIRAEVAEMKGVVENTEDAVQEMKMNQEALSEKVETTVQKMNEEFNRNFVDLKERLLALTRRIAQANQGEKNKEDIAGNTSQSQETKSRIIIAGGYVPGTGEVAHSSLHSVEEYCSERKSWLPLAQMKNGRRLPSPVVFGNQMLICGGLDENNKATDTIECLEINPRNNSNVWREFPARFPKKLYGHSCVVYKNGKMIVVAGSEAGNKVTDCVYEVMSSKSFFMGQRYHSKLLGHLPQKRFLHGVSLHKDKVFVFGGRTSRAFKDSLASVVAFDISKEQYKIKQIFITSI